MHALSSGSTQPRGKAFPQDTPGPALSQEEHEPFDELCRKPARGRFPLCHPPSQSLPPPPSLWRTGRRTGRAPVGRSFMREPKRASYRCANAGFRPCHQSKKRFGRPVMPSEGGSLGKRRPARIEISRRRWNPSPTIPRSNSDDSSCSWFSALFRASWEQRRQRSAESEQREPTPVGRRQRALSGPVPVEAWKGLRRERPSQE